MLKYIRHEWEKTACLAAALLLALVVLDWVVADDGEIRHGAGVPPPMYVSRFGPDAFAFLRDPVLPRPIARNPFHFSGAPKPRRRPPRRRPAPKPVPKPPPAPKPVPKPAPNPAPKPVQPQPPAPRIVPRYRLGRCDLKFVYNTVNRSGKPVALIELADPSRPGRTPLAKTVGIGDRIYGLRILDVSDTALTLVDAGGKRQRIAFGRSRRVTIRLATGAR